MVLQSVGSYLIIYFIISLYVLATYPVDYGVSIWANTNFILIDSMF